MKRLWILRILNKADQEVYGTHQGFVVRSETEQQARHLAWIAEEEAAYPGQSQKWLDAALTSCDELTAEGESEVVMVDFLHESI